MTKRRKNRNRNLQKAARDKPGSGGNPNGPEKELQSSLRTRQSRETELPPAELLRERTATVARGHAPQSTGAPTELAEHTRKIHTTLLVLCTALLAFSMLVQESAVRLALEELKDLRQLAASWTQEEVASAIASIDASKRQPSSFLLAETKDQSKTYRINYDRSVVAPHALKCIFSILRSRFEPANLFGDSEVVAQVHTLHDLQRVWDSHVLPFDIAIPRKPSKTFLVDVDPDQGLRRKQLKGIESRVAFAVVDTELESEIAPRRLRTRGISRDLTFLDENQQVAVLVERDSGAEIVPIDIFGLYNPTALQISGIAPSAFSYNRNDSSYAVLHEKGIRFIDSHGKVRGQLDVSDYSQLRFPIKRISFTPQCSELLIQRENSVERIADYRVNMGFFSIDGLSTSQSLGFGNSNGIEAFAMDSEGHRLVVASTVSSGFLRPIESRLSVFSYATAEEVASIDISSVAQERVVSICFGASESRFYTGHLNGEVRSWVVAQGTREVRQVNASTIHSGAVSGVATAGSFGGLITCGVDGNVHRVSEDLDIVATRKSPLRFSKIVCSPDGSVAALTTQFANLHRVSRCYFSFSAANPERLLLVGGASGSEKGIKPPYFESEFLFETAPVDLSSVLIKKLPRRWHAAVFSRKSFEKSFPNLWEVTREDINLPLDDVERKLELYVDFTDQELSVFGISFPAIFINRFGLWMMCAVNLYFLLHLQRLRHNLVLQGVPDVVPWIALYPDWGSKLTFFLASTVFPLGVGGWLYASGGYSFPALMGLLVVGAESIIVWRELSFIDANRG
ncbi:MAG: hypothetical protein ABJZ55_15160 [Fuerstiella sp.]